LASALVVPGVSVEARFDILPPLPTPSGIVGAAGIVDRLPTPAGLVSVSRVSELRALLGPGTPVTMPEVVHALATGASEVVVSPVAGGSPAFVDLVNDDSAKVIRLRARCNGKWANDLSVDVKGIADTSGKVVRVTLRLLRFGAVVEEFDGLRVVPGDPFDLFEVINTTSSLVVAFDPALDGVEPAPGTYTFTDLVHPTPVPEQGGASALFNLVPTGAVPPVQVSVVIAATASAATVRVLVKGAVKEQFQGLTMDPDSPHYLPAVLASQSALVRAQLLSSQAAGKQLPHATTDAVPFTSGSSPQVSDYLTALDLLTDDTRIDTLLACLEPARDGGDVHQVHSAMTAQAVAMADAGAPCIAYGSITAAEDVSDTDRLGRLKEHGAVVRNRRFVLVSPPGAAGVVAGLVARLDPQDSPTFKPAPMFEVPPATYRQSELDVLLGPDANLCVVENRAGHGVIVLKGIDTTGDQISVTRVADEAIRETKAICENFIGVLNSDDARIALKAQIVATFTRMEREGALVPSTDGTDPAFVVDVYSTQQDFAQGIVRVDIAVRPVRSIDYVYATIRVKN
jgi:Phage tail sheath C-terminal domain